MIRCCIAAVGLVAASATVSAQDLSEVEARPIEVMVLGTYHFSNPGQDVVNLEVDDVLAPKRQREIEILVQTLAQWKPTKVAVEWQARPPALQLEPYADIDNLLKTDRDESVQIGFRLAQILGHKAVFGIDEKPGEGEPDYFPLGDVQAFAEADGRADELGQLFAVMGERVEAEQAKLADQSIAQSLIFHNDAATVDAGHDEIYYGMLNFGDGEQQPGAVLNALWYMRNAKMFAKLDLVAEPGDRVFLIVGSGHATWLRHFVRRTPGYELVDSMPYVLGAAAASDDMGN